MAFLVEVEDYEAGVYQLETTDPVEGGPGGIANAQAQSLANRAKYLKAHLDAAEADIASIETEIANARSGELTLDARIDAVMAAAQSHSAGTLTGNTLAAGVVNSSLTSVGTLTSLTVSPGAASFQAVAATTVVASSTGQFGGTLTVTVGGIAITGNSTISGTLGGISTFTATNIGGTLTTAAQPNVTSLGALTGVTVSGAASVSGGITSTRAGVAFIGDNTSAATILGLLQGKRGGVTRWFIGFNASDAFALLNAAGDAANIAVTDAGVATIRAGLTVSAGTTAVQALAATMVTISSSPLQLTASAVKVNLNRTGGTAQESTIHFLDSAVEKWAMGQALSAAGNAFELWNYTTAALALSVAAATSAVTFSAGITAATVTVSGGLTVSSGTSAFQEVTATTITPTGAVTLSHGQFLRGTRLTGSLVHNLIGNEAGTDRVILQATGDWVLVNGSADENLKITTAGAGIFRSDGRFNSGSTGSSALTLGPTAPSANGSGYIRLINSNAVKNWQIGTNDTVAGNFEISSSTTVGGSTFTASVFKLTDAGALALAASITANAPSVFNGGTLTVSAGGIAVTGGSTFSAGVTGARFNSDGGDSGAIADTATFDIPLPQKQASIVIISAFTVADPTQQGKTGVILCGGATGADWSGAQTRDIMGDAGSFVTSHAHSSPNNTTLRITNNSGRTVNYRWAIIKIADSMA
ncbi:MAG: hypothetical protein WD825_17415 [Gemmatimonadaceae bacterium]